MVANLLDDWPEVEWGLRHRSHGEENTLKIGYRLRWLFALLAMTVAAGPLSSVMAQEAATPVASPTATSGFSAAPCTFTLPPELVDGTDISCGYLTVPERHENPDGPKIQLAVGILAPVGGEAVDTPLVVLNGGPGQDSTVILQALAMPAIPTSQLRQNRQVIVFDQRGVGVSQPSLACPEITENDALYNVTDPIEAQTLVTGLAVQCRDRLVGDGVDLGAYTSAQSAADIAALRVALGYDQIDLYGVSYGTRLALTVLRDHPDGIRSVILDANYPPQADLYADAAATFNEALQGVFAGCAEDAFCAQINSDLPGALQKTVDQLNASPVEMTITPYGLSESIDLTLDGRSFLNSVVFPGLYATPLIPLVPYVITTASNGIMEPTKQFLMLLLASSPVSYGMYYSIQCSEEIPFADQTPPATPEADALPLLPVIRDYFDVDAGLIAVCAEWPVDAPNPIENEPVASDVPTLIVDGEFDPVTSPDNAALIAETLPNSTVQIFPGGGHSLLDQPCPIAVFIEFLSDPTVTPDLSCAAEMGADFSPDLGL